MENAECIQSLCIFYFDFFSATLFSSLSIAVFFVPGCCWLAVTLLRTARKQQQRSKPVRIQ